MILVVIRHVLQYSVLDEGGILTNLIWAIQMPGFMLVSGYFVARPSNKIGKAIEKSCERYLLPFLSWWILICVLLLGRCDRNIITGLNTLFHNVDGGLWFLWVVFALSVLAAFVNRIISSNEKKFKKIVLSFITCCVYFGVLLIVVVLYRDVSMFGIKYILYYSVFYGFGFILRWTENVWKPYWQNLKNHVVFISFIIFLAIIFNYDLYHCEDGLLSIMLRCITGFAGNLVLYNTVERFQEILSKIKFPWIGKYTLEIYATHMLVNNLFTVSNKNIFWSTEGFVNFTVSLICTCVFTVIIISVFKSIPLANFLMYGKRDEK